MGYGQEVLVVYYVLLAILDNNDIEAHIIIDYYSYLLFRQRAWIHIIPHKVNLTDAPLREGSEARILHLSKSYIPIGTGGY